MMSHGASMITDSPTLLSADDPVAPRAKGPSSASARRAVVIGMEVLGHLRASHIKPWSVSDDPERLDGANGVLLSPHADHVWTGEGEMGARVR